MLLQIDLEERGFQYAQVAVHVTNTLTKYLDPHVAEHQQRVSAYAALIASRLPTDRFAISADHRKFIEIFAPLHDIGKLGIPHSILHKPGKLDPDEWQVMRGHVTAGESMVDQIFDSFSKSNPLGFEVLRNIVSYHHERGDGSGYPRGVTMEAIPIEGRIVAVADVYDALSTIRSYKPAWQASQIRDELQKQTEAGALDKSCVDALLESINDGIA